MKITLLSLLVSLVTASPLLASSAAVQETSGTGVPLGTTASLTFQNPVNVPDVVVVAIVYANKKNRKSFTVSGLGATWASYTPPFKKVGVDFFYATSVAADNSLTVTSKYPDGGIVVLAQEWTDLTPVEDKKARKVKRGVSSTPTIKGKTKNATDALFNVVGYFGTAAFPSPPTGPLLSMGLAGSGPYLTGGFGILNTAGAYTNGFTLQGSTSWTSVAMALKSSGDNSLYDQPALTDYTAGQLYLGQFPGFLYNGSNTPTPQHDADGKAAAAQVQPLDASGNPSSSGIIGVAGIGISNFTEELCTGNDNVAATPCDPGTFLDQVNTLSGVNPAVVAIDCAKGGAYTVDWDDPTLSSTAWQTCLGRLATFYNVTPAQIQVVIFEAGEQNPSVALRSLPPGTSCPANPNPAVDPDACVYEASVGRVARILKNEFPNLKQMFLQPRIYSGYADREPYSYEIGFATKWLIAAQTAQIASGTVDPVGGDLSYGSAPWLGWSAYTWGPGAVPRADGQFWLANNYEWDGIHPSQCRFAGIDCGRTHSADLMMDYFTTTPYAPWLLAPQP